EAGHSSYCPDRASRGSARELKCQRGGTEGRPRKIRNLECECRIEKTRSDRGQWAPAFFILPSHSKFLVFLGQKPRRATFPPITLPGYFGRPVLSFSRVGRP